ncbi:MAG: hypothetical protein ACOYOS_14070 [Syntrophales bacterium]
MSVKVTYSTKAFPVDNQNKVGEIIQITFSSLEEAKNKPLPEGYVFAYIPVEEEYYTYTTTLGWEFHPNK